MQVWDGLNPRKTSGATRSPNSLDHLETIRQIQLSQTEVNTKVPYTGADTPIDLNGQDLTSGKLTSSSGRVSNVSRYTTTQTLDDTDHIVLGDTDSSAWVLTLPAGVSGTTYKIINVGSSNNTLTVSPDGAELLLGENSSFTLLDGDTITITYDTTEGWW
jgi:hypothetical protein